jgi:endonuclease I
MKKLLLSAFAAFALATGMAQTAALPTSYDWATGSSLPVGWTSTGTGVYTAAATGMIPPACKFDNTGDSLTIRFSSTPGSLSYKLTGNSFSGGTFLVQESVGGSSWTTLHSFTSPPSATYTLFTDTPNPASRYIRFYYQTKVSGNIGVDDVSISAGVSATQQINVKQGTTTIVNGGNYTVSSPVSVTAPINFTIENTGTVGTLNVTGASITGPAAADFTIVSPTSFSVAPSSSTTFTVNFTPSVAGTRDAVLSISNDDPTNNPYIIDLNGIGGSFASEPSSQPTGLNFTQVRTYRMNGSFTAAAGSPDGYLILKKVGSAITDVPVDGTVYQRGDLIGACKVVASGPMTNFVPNEIVAGTTFHFAIFAYNGTGTYRNYRTVAPLTGSQATPATMMPATYYNGISTSSPSFVTDLHNKINPHTMHFYSNYGPYMVSKFYARDTVNGQRVVTCVYSGENWVYSEPWDWASNDFSREHTFCHSWQPTYTDPNTTNLPQYNDYHMLEPTDQNDVNGIRSNYPLGEVVSPTYTFFGCKLGLNAAGQKVFEPRDSDKGNAARCMLYESICYTGVAGNLWALPNYISATIPYGQDQNVLKKWHYQDPPDALEIARNDYVDSLQGNRNPLIDSTHYICYIDFSNMTKISSPMVPCATAGVGIDEASASTDMMMIAPNPTDGNFTLTFITEKSQNIGIRVIDVFGRLVYSEQAKVNNGFNPIVMNIEGLAKGMYSVEVQTEKGRTAQKLVIR